MVEIPLEAMPNQELQTTLGEQDCTLQVRQIGKFIYLSLWIEQTLIRQNSICMPSTAIIQGRSTFSGNLFMVDTSADFYHQTNPDYTELGSRYKLLYLTDAEVAEYEL